MLYHKIQSDWKERLKAAVPFGLGQVKPKHFRDMAEVAWKNRDNLGYAWKVLSREFVMGALSASPVSMTGPSKAFTSV